MKVFLQPFVFQLYIQNYIGSFRQLTEALRCDIISVIKIKRGVRMEKITQAQRLKPPVPSAKAVGRNPSMDVLRIFAFSMIVVTHFFLQSEYYTRALVGPRMLVMTVVRSFGVTCVPTFILLTGFLMKNKTWSGKYYSGLKKTLATYFFASIPCYLYGAYAADKLVSVRGFIGDVLSFKAAEYSWYIEMYIGLFLLIPFLNVLWNNLPSKKQRLVLIVTLIALTNLPSLINIYDFGKEGWWLTPVISKKYNPLIPDWWTNAFPLTYYFIGCYIREYPVKIKRWVNLLLIAVVGISFGAFCFYRSTPQKFLAGSWHNYNSMFDLALCVLIFIFFANLDLTAWPERLKRLCTRLSEICLGAYLLSNIPDEFFYAILNERVADVAKRFDYFIIIVPVCIISSLVLAFLVNIVSKISVRLWDKAEGLVAALFSKSRKKA